MASSDPPPLHLFRPEVRGETPYLVATPPATRVKLNQNESPFDLPDELKTRLSDRLRALPLNRYPSDQPARLARTLGQHLAWPSEGLLIGNGSNDLAQTLGLALVAPGTPVVLPRPMFALYESVVRMHAGEITSVAPRDDFRFDTDALVEAIRTRQPALTILATPNNPTGRAMPLGDLEDIVTAAEGYVLVDEAYYEFSEEESARKLLPEHPNLFLMRTFSKAWGLAALRLGYLIGHPPVIRELLKARLPFMIDPVAEEAACMLLDRPELVRERVAALKASCAVLTAHLQDLPGVDVIPSQANFVLFKTALEPELLKARLAEQGVLVRNMSGYPELDGYVRVSAGLPKENKAFLDALKHALTSGS